MFKLIDFINVTYFNELRQKMNAPLAEKFAINLSIESLDEELIAKLGREGVDVFLDEILINDDNTFSYNGQRVLVYIRDVSFYSEHYSMPRFHIAHCKTLQKMTENGRQERYVITNRDDGYFDINLINKKRVAKKEALLVCQHCLVTLAWNNFSIGSKEKNIKNVSKFSISAFFEKYPKSLHVITPSYTADTAPVNEYTKDFDEVSKAIRIKRNNQCENSTCGRIFSPTSLGSLHVHHINGLKYDNREINLKVLCVRCHAEEPYHGFMKKVFLLDKVTP